MTVAALSHSPGFLIRLSQNFNLKPFLCFIGCVLLREVITFLFIVDRRGIYFSYRHWRLIIRVSNIDLEATVVISCKICRTAKLVVMQFWCVFRAIKLAVSVDFSFWLTSRIKSGYVPHITLCSVNLIGEVSFDFRMVVFARGNLLYLRVDWDDNVFLILQSLTCTYCIPINSGLTSFLLRLSLNQIVLFLPFSLHIHAEHLAKHILIVQLIFRYPTYDIFCCLLNDFAILLSILSWFRSAWLSFHILINSFLIY